MRKLKLVSLLLIIICALCGCNNLDYRKAAQLYEDGNYVEAISMYRKLGDYEDSGNLLLTSSYDYLFSYIKENNNKIELSDTGYLTTDSENIVFKNEELLTTDKNGLKTEMDTYFSILLYKDNSDVICTKLLGWTAYYNGSLYKQGSESGEAIINRNEFYRHTPIQLTKYINTMPVKIADDETQKEMFRDSVEGEFTKAIDSISTFLEKEELGIDIKDLGFYVYE